jgi:hypothetical protein
MLTAKTTVGVHAIANVARPTTVDAASRTRRWPYRLTEPTAGEIPDEQAYTQRAAEQACLANRQLTRASKVEGTGQCWDGTSWVECIGPTKSR